MTNKDDPVHVEVVLPAGTKVSSSNPFPIIQSSQPLPTGAATESTLRTVGSAQTDGTQKTVVVNTSGTELANKNGFAKIINCDSIITTRCAGVSPNRDLQVATQVRMVGTSFDGNVLDPNFWTPTTTNSGTATVNGEVELITGTATNSTVKISSVRKGRFVVSNPMEFKTVCEWYTVADTDNLRRVGAYDTDNGYFFQLDGSTFSTGTRTNKSGTAVTTLVNSGNFNGDVTTYNPSTDRHKCSIQYTGRSVYFIIDGVLIHKVVLTHDNQPSTSTLPVTVENINDNGNTTNNEFHIMGAVINRMGKLSTNSTYKYIATDTTTVLKYTSGVLHRIINNDNQGAITVWDNTAGSGTQIAGVDCNKVLGDLNFNAPFSNGLTIVTTGGAKITVGYE